jgi:hypothetical protein
MSYLAYYQVIESSGTKVSDNLEELKQEWCFAMRIYDIEDSKEEDIRQDFKEKYGQPEMGTFPNYLDDRFKLVYEEGVMLHKVNK